MDTRVLFDTLVGNKGNTDTGGNQVQGGMGGIYCADDRFIGRCTGGPLLETFSNIIVKYHLRLLYDILRINIAAV